MIKIVTVAQKRGYILATDISPQMLSISKQRAISLDLSDMIEIKVGDTETIDLPISIFDSALCRAGLMLLPDLKVGLLNIYRSLIEGGRFAAAVWSSPDKVPFISVGMNAVMKETDIPLPPPRTPGSLANQTHEKKERY